MITEKAKEKLVALICEKYKSLDAPDFSFVREALSIQPYAKVIQKIARGFDLEEDTDPNDDVSFGYLLTKEHQRWMLRISMVGPYAVLFRLDNAESVEVLSPIMPGLSAAETSLVVLLSEAHIQLMDRDTLSLPVPLQLFNTEPENSRLYQALFVDSDVVPWETPVQKG
jgi:hypothetical protein